MHNIFEGPPQMQSFHWGCQLFCDVYPATNFCLSYCYLFWPVLFACFSLPLDEIPESSQTFSGCFSLGNNNNTTQATLTSKLWALLQLKSLPSLCLRPSGLGSLRQERGRVRLLPHFLSLLPLAFTMWGDAVLPGLGMLQLRVNEHFGSFFMLCTFGEFL